MCTDDQHKQKMQQALSDIHQLLIRRTPLDSLIMISASQPYVLNYSSRKHVFIWSPNTLTLTLEDLGNLSLTNATWTNVSLTAGMKIYALGETTPIPILVRCTDEIEQSNIIGSAALGYVPAYASNAAALTSSTDYSFKWGANGLTQVNHVMLQNNTGANINWDLDVAATAGSPILATGQTLFLDVQTLVLHLFQAGTPNVNGSTGSNIVVRGWL